MCVRFCIFIVTVCLYGKSKFNTCTGTSYYCSFCIFWQHFNYFCSVGFLIIKCTETKTTMTKTGMRNVCSLVAAPTTIILEESLAKAKEKLKKK